MTTSTNPRGRYEVTEKQRSSDPGTEATFQVFSLAMCGNGALSSKIKQLIAHGSRSCDGAILQEHIEAAWVVVETRPGALFVHSALMLDAPGPPSAKGQRIRRTEDKLLGLHIRLDPIRRRQ